MSPELERALVSKYPKLFVDYGTAPSHSPMAFGFECGDGWYDLLDTLCAQLIELDSDGGVPDIRAMQVKEKYGTLRFYVGPATDEALALVAFAEAISAKICETCGNKGRKRGTTWLKTLCDSCAQKEGYVDATTDIQL